MKQHISKEELIQRIECADGMEIDEVIKAIQRRYTRVHPDWEVVMLSMPTGSEEKRKEQGHLLTDFIRKHYLEE